MRHSLGLDGGAKQYARVVGPVSREEFFFCSVFSSVLEFRSVLLDYCKFFCGLGKRSAFK